MANKILEKIIESSEVIASRLEEEAKKAQKAKKSRPYVAESYLKKLTQDTVHYAKRYGVAELAATAASTVASELIYRATKDESLTAHAATLAGYISFFGAIAAQEMYSKIKKIKEGSRNFKPWNALNIPVNIIKEFGAASYLDLIVTRPYILKECIRYFGASTGGFLGKWVADIPFYLICAVSNKYFTKNIRKLKLDSINLKGG